VSERWRPLGLADTDPDPFVQFDRWFDDADGLMAEREAVALASATREGRPSLRMVLLRWHDGRSFGWYTNYESRKGRELTENPRAALLWYCEALGRQIRIEGDVARMSADESDAYFASRPRSSQIGAHASHQSATLESRAALETRVHELEERFEGGPVERPGYWGGFRLSPERFEFWQHRESRLHDRIVYRRADEVWQRERLSP
jgi:pyridoxamine 5'-phosphate oxidase